MPKQSENKLKKGHTYVQWIVAFVAELTLLTYGLQAGWMSPMTKILKSPSSPAGRPLTDMELTWIASLLPLGGVMGVSLFVYLADNHGRKTGVLVMAVLQSICWIIKLSSTRATSLMIANVFAGVAAGGCFQLIPVYVKEISQDNIRGMLVSMFLLMQNIGIFTMYAIGAYLDYCTVLWIGLVIALIAVVALVKAPETPPFLVKEGKYEEAAATLALLRGLDANDKEIQNEMDYMKENDRQFKSLPDVTVLSIVKNSTYRKGLSLVILVVSMQAFNGVFAIVTYASTIMSASGVTLSPELQTLSIPIVMIVGSFVSMNCVDRIDRKVILSVAFALTTAAHVSLGSSLLVLHGGGGVPGWLPVLAIIVAVWAYAAGLLPIPYVIMTEMFNFQIRAKVAGCVVSYSWFLSFMQLFLFTPASALLGVHHTVLCFAVVNLLGLLAALLAVPETRGKTVEEIEIMLAKK